MTKAKKTEDTHITLVMDRSGSMARIAADMEGGVNEFMRSQVKLPGKCTVSLIRFDTEIDVVHEGVPIKDVPPLKIEPRGSTALNDAIQRGIAVASKSKAPKQLFVIVTDGQENASRECTGAQVKAEIERLSSGKSPWAFMFFGSTKDAIGQATSYGISGSNVMGYEANAIGVMRATHSMSAAGAGYRTGSLSAKSLNVSKV